MKQLPFAGRHVPGRADFRSQGVASPAAARPAVAETQLTELFTGSGVTTFDAVNGEGRTPRRGSAAFADKVQQIREAGPCPANLPRRKAPLPGEITPASTVSPVRLIAWK